MSVVDTLVVAVLAIGLVLGLMRGFLSQVTGLAGLLGGLYLASRYHEPLRRNALDPFFDTSHNGAIAFISIMVFVVLTAAVVGYVVSKLVEKLELGAYDRLMGAAFGIVKTGLVAAGLLLGLVYFAPNDGRLEQAISASKSGPLLWRAMDNAAGVLPPSMRASVRTFLGDNSLPSRLEPADQAARSE